MTLHSDDGRFVANATFELVSAALNNISWNWIVLEKEGIVWLRIDKKRKAKYRIEFCFNNSHSRWTHPLVEYDKVVDVVDKFLRQDPVWQKDPIWYDEASQRTEGKELMFYSSLALTFLAILGNIFYGPLLIICDNYDIGASSLLVQLSLFAFILTAKPSFNKMFHNQVQGWISLIHFFYVVLIIMLFIVSLSREVAL